MQVGLLIFVLLLLGISIRLMAGALDGGRVERYLQERGWKLIEKSWRPFGPGWFGEKSNRIYEVVFEDREGNVHRAHVKTSMLSGVYLTNDRVVRPAEPKPRPDLRAENERLRQRIAELEDRDTAGG